VSPSAPSVRRPLFFCCLLGVAVAAGCSKGGQQVPVKGKITLGDKPLKLKDPQKGSVTFYPDKDKGNTSTGLPVGELNAEGEYELSWNGKPGAPTGWYKVVVVANEPTNPKDPYSIPRPLVNRKWADEKTTDLSVEVVSGAAEGAYDFKVGPP
jgi:hypothetical protein